MMKTRILIVEDINAARIHLSGMVKAAFCDLKDECLELILAQNLHEARSACFDNSEQPFNYALIDIKLPDGSGLDLLRELTAAKFGTNCVVTTIMSTDDTIVEALSAGAGGYLLKNQPDGQMIRQIKQLREGIPAISPSIARRIMDHFKTRPPPSETNAELTPREQDVLKLIACGMRIADAARELNVAPSTVASHVKSIYQKLDISNRAQATLVATRLGLID